TLQENNIVELVCAELATFYGHDFEQLWDDGNYESSGAFDTRWVEMRYRGRSLKAYVFFAPGRGDAIDHNVAEVVRGASRRVRVCSMLLNSSALLTALLEVLRAGTVPVSGIYDRTQMADVLRQWQLVPHNQWKIDVVHDIVAEAGLVGKLSTPY